MTNFTILGGSLTFNNRNLTFIIDGEKIPVKFNYEPLAIVSDEFDGLFIELPDDFPCEIFEDIFIFENLPNQFELVEPENLAYTLEQYYGTSNVAKIKSIIKDIIYLNEIGIEDDPEYDDFGSIVTKCGEYTIHHNRHKRRLGSDIAPIFVYGKDIHICPNEHNSNGVIFDTEDGLAICKYGQTTIFLNK